jgi:hypothetical protein
LTSVRRFFASKRRSLAPRLGRVGRRDGGGGRRASATTAASRARAAFRLRNCSRCSDAAIVRTPSTTRPLRRSSSRSRWSGERTAEPATSHTSSARESAVFTPCPPGPDDRENRQDSSDSGIVSPESTRRPGRWAAGMEPSSSSARNAPGTRIAMRQSDCRSSRWIKSRSRSSRIPLLATIPPTDPFAGEHAGTPPLPGIVARSWIGQR